MGGDQHRALRGQQLAGGAQGGAVGGKAKAQADQVGAGLVLERGEPAQGGGNAQRAGHRAVVEDLRMHDRRAG